MSCLQECIWKISPGLASGGGWPEHLAEGLGFPLPACCWAALWLCQSPEAEELPYVTRFTEKCYMCPFGGWRCWGCWGGRWARVGCEKFQFKLNKYGINWFCEVRLLLLLRFYRKTSHSITLLGFGSYISHIICFHMFHQCFKASNSYLDMGWQSSLQYFLAAEALRSFIMFPLSQWSLPSNDEIPLFVCHIWRMAHGLLGG